MFEFIFGWRKASKCKKLIREAHSRLNLLKNKRSCIVKQLRNDVTQLIKHDHYQVAFNRVGQIYKDECIVAVYDKLIHYCESICFQLSYIRRNKDCPNDIKEAISSLVFASSRCGDVPELVRIRKLFGQRYGERFVSTALELSPGNHVNFKIIQNLSIMEVADEVKHKLLEEIATTVSQTQPLALEFTSKLHQKETKSNASNQAVEGNRNEQIAHLEFDQPAGDDDQSIMDPVGADYSSENSNTDSPEEIVYLDDIQEFQSPLSNNENGKDQRVFVFTSSAIVPVVEIHKHQQFIDFDMEKSEGLRMETKGSRKLDHEDMVVKRGMGSRAMTMPAERLMKCLEEKSVVRSISFPVQPSPPHVHPKLPDYDELEAMFMALKKQNLQNHK